jgi:abortive infection bacteriophage resistance protein
MNNFFVINPKGGKNIMAINKVFKNLDEQVEIIRNRNIKVTNEVKVKKKLLHNNYFNVVNGNETLFLSNKSPKIFRKINFNQLYRMTELDKRISNKIFGIIANIETKLQSITAYRLSEFLSSNPSTIADNLKYMDINSYTIPKITSAPNKYVEYFYDPDYDSKRHPFLKKKLKVNNIKFTGQFEGDVCCKDGAIYFEGKFNGSVDSFKNNRYEGRFYPSITTGYTTGPSQKFTISEISGNFSNLDFANHAKMTNPSVNEYYNPPLWVVIKTLHFNDIITLIYGLNVKVTNSILTDFGFSPKEKDKFLNSLEIIRELRNKCAHFDMITRFRTSSNLKINNLLISSLGLKPKNANKYILKLNDSLKVLNQFESTSKINKIVHRFYRTNKIKGRSWLNEEFKKRIG